MTIASGPARPYLDFAVQRTASEFKRAFFGLAPGDTVQITAPRGHFLLDRERPAAMIASGIGVTPFRSMLQALADENATLSGAIVHATHGPIDVPFRDELEALARRTGLRLSRENGPVDEVQLRTLASEIAGPVWYIAGQVEDVKHVRELLGSIGVEKKTFAWKPSATPVASRHRRSRSVHPTGTRSPGARRASRCPGTTPESSSAPEGAPGWGRNNVRFRNSAD